ncbi:MAG: MBL fold metallo-hydrolase [Deltaproteobacteria bacterium]|nr:MBL fold metallo-hydrolase [Deltaproteobacteria bacterium]
MVSITAYGGVNEVGGNQILVQDGKNRIFLDFGMSFGKFFTYFDAFLAPRKLNGMGDYFELGLIPPIAGIYRNDYLKHMGRPQEPLSCDGLFISHAHGDHIGMLHFLREDLTIHGTPETLKIMESLEETSVAGLTEYVNLKRTFEFYQNKKGGLSRLEGEKAKVPRKIEAVDKPVEIGQMKIRASPVNHSIPGATAYIIETPSGTLAYSGDLRFHGYGGHLTEKFVKEAAGVDTLIIEGTRMEHSSSMTEEELTAKVKTEIEATKGIVLANWPIRDVERLISFLKAAKSAGRYLAINPKQANLLEKLGEANSKIPKPTDPAIKIFVTRKSWGLIDRKLPDLNLVNEDYKEWERKYLHASNMVDYNELRDNPSAYVVRADFFDMTELTDIRPNETSCYIRSVCEPFDEKMEFNEAIVNSWLDHFHVGRRPPTIHCSGHAPGQDIKRIVEEINPKTIIPVHTEKAAKFNEFGKKCILPVVGSIIQL